MNELSLCSCFLDISKVASHVLFWANLQCDFQIQEYLILTGMDAGRQLGDHEDHKDGTLTAGEVNDQWRFTPLLDSTSFSFASFANQATGYYTPTPGGTSTIYHNQAGDLHTPGMAFHLGTPLSMPTSDGNVHSAIDMHGFHPHLLGLHSFQTAATFNPQQSYAPSSFVHQDSGFEAMDAETDGLPKQDIIMEAEPHRELPVFPNRVFDTSMPAPAVPSIEK